MTPTQLDHLRAIDAHLTKLLETAEKRTPGEWCVTPGVYDCSTEATQFPEGPSIRLAGKDDILFNLGQEPNAAFIASCAGNAEAGWRATKAAIAWATFMHENGQVGEGLLEAILAAWPLELLTLP